MNNLTDADRAASENQKILANQLRPPALLPTAYKHKRYLFAGVVALQIISFLGVGAAKAYTLGTGTVVALKTVPVDPYDPFRGDYVRLNYEKFPTGWRNIDGGPVLDYYVLLEKGEPYWHVVESGPNKPVAKANQIVIKGKYGKYGYFGGGSDFDFGIGRYYVREGTGLALEREKSLKVEVAVDCFNNAVIKSVSAVK